jgi:cyclase
MLRSRIIPSLLMRDKGLVKTRQFKDEKYVGDPLNAVKIFNEKEVDELAFFDIGATAAGASPDLALLSKIAMQSRMPLCYGGGITSAAEAAEIIRIGFEKVSVSAAAISRPDLIDEMATRVGRQSVVVTIDVKKSRLGGYTIYTHNGTRKHKLKLADFVSKATERGAGEIVINSIDRDGMMQGYDISLARSISASTSLPLTMLGGAGTIDHMAELIEALGIVGAAAGSMFVFKGTYRAVLISYARP